MTRAAGATDIIASERLMVSMRWLIALWAVFQVSVDDDFYPDGVRAWAYVLVGLLLFGNLALMFVTARSASDRDAHRLAVASMAFDLALVMSFVWLYAYDPDRSLWALMFLVPVAGAARFRMRGVLWSWAGVASLYVVKELWASSMYGYEFDATSVTFRMGLVLLVGVLAGRLARQLHEQKAELARALDRLEQVDDWRSRLVQMLAHDVRSPLAFIDSTVDSLLLRSEQLEPDQVRQLLESIRRQSGAVQHLASDLLDLARSEQESLRLRLEPFDLRQLVEEMTSLVAGADGAVDVQGPEAVEVVADRDRLAQVYRNLLGNALRHGQPPIEVRVGATDGDAELAVTDRGEGVAADRQDELFGAFSGDGTSTSVGLGLWVARMLIESHGGTLEYVRDQSAGRTIFRARFPSVPAVR